MVRICNKPIVSEVICSWHIALYLHNKAHYGSIPLRTTSQFSLASSATIC